MNERSELSYNKRQEIKEWVSDCKHYGFIEGNPLISRALRIYEELLKEDE